MSGVSSAASGRARLWSAGSALTVASPGSGHHGTTCNPCARSARAGDVLTEAAHEVVEHEAHTAARFQILVHHHPDAELEGQHTREQGNEAVAPGQRQLT